MKTRVLIYLGIVVVVTGCVSTPTKTDGASNRTNISGVPDDNKTSKNISRNQTSRTNQNQDNLTMRVYYDNNQIRYDSLPKYQEEVPDDKISCQSFVDIAVPHIIDNRTKKDIPYRTGIASYEKNGTAHISITLVVTEKIEGRVGEVEKTLKNAMPSRVKVETKYRNQTYGCSMNVRYDGRGLPAVPH